jgi:hypothetical protein
MNIWVQFPASVAQAPLKSNALAEQVSNTRIPDKTARATMFDADIQRPSVFFNALRPVARFGRSQE